MEEFKQGNIELVKSSNKGIGLGKWVGVSGLVSEVRFRKWVL